jgi:hypothetical protein
LGKKFTIQIATEGEGTETKIQILLKFITVSFYCDLKAKR